MPETAPKSVPAVIWEVALIVVSYLLGMLSGYSVALHPESSGRKQEPPRTPPPVVQVSGFPAPTASAPPQR